MKLIYRIIRSLIKRGCVKTKIPLLKCYSLIHCCPVKITNCSLKVLKHS